MRSNPSSNVGGISFSDMICKAGPGTIRARAAFRLGADDLEALVVHLRYPIRHRRRWRSTNLLERSLGEVKRRTKVIGRFPGETSCLTLVWAVLDLYITHATNGIKFTQLERQRFKRIRYGGSEQTIPEEVSAA